MSIDNVSNGGVCTPIGFSASAVSADVKGNVKNKLDFALLVSDETFNAAAVFTTNRVTAAPVKYSKHMLTQGEEFTGIIVNSGNANACTGENGMEACGRIVKEAEKLLDLPPNSLFAASTGVIGQQMPVERMLPMVSVLVDELDDDNGSAFAEAIMTTDTVVKQCAVIVHTDRGSYSIGGACKGAGMIDPCMATLLSFITTDADIDTSDLQAILNSTVETTFNSITIDGDRSTNDSLFVFANGMADVGIDTLELKTGFAEALEQVCRELALMLVRDGEGATKCVEVNVKGAKSNAEAKLCAAAVSNSSLVKTMFAGCDPNWGRLMSSAGASGAVFEEDKVAIWFNDLKYVENGMIIDPQLEEKVYSIMKESEYSITIDLNAGEGQATCYTCDLTKEYVAINADYRS